jgi:chain length determinant protein tyrosine kinase EpsG
MSVRGFLGLKAVDSATPLREALANPHPPSPERPIGDFIREARSLSEAQIEQIVAYQAEHRLRFGEAAVALRLASADDVLWALSQQFHYPYCAASGAEIDRELVAAIDPFGSQSEAIRGIRSQLMMEAMAPDLGRRALAVLSPDVGDGKSFLAANLAIVFSQLGAPTLLIDADMRTPRQHQLFAIPNESGLSGILAGRAESSVIHMVRDLPSLFVLPVGTLPPNPLDLLQRPAFGQLLQDLLTRFDHIVVDTPAASHGRDARVVAAKCGSALIVGRRGTTRMREVDALIDDISRAPVKLAGVVLNDH